MHGQWPRWVESHLPAGICSSGDPQTSAVSSEQSSSQCHSVHLWSHTLSVHVVPVVPCIVQGLWPTLCHGRECSAALFFTSVRNQTLGLMIVLYMCTQMTATSVSGGCTITCAWSDEAWWACKRSLVSASSWSDTSEDSCTCDQPTFFSILVASTNDYLTACGKFLCCLLLLHLSQRKAQRFAPLHGLAMFLSHCL